jgi:hypothetical protein
MDKQAEALEQWLDRIRSSDDAVRSQAAYDLAMVLEKYVGPFPYMPPDYEGWIPDELRLRLGLDALQGFGLGERAEVIRLRSSGTGARQTGTPDHPQAPSSWPSDPPSWAVCLRM